MAEDNIKDFTINWIVVGLLTFCLVSFTISFMYHNNPIGLGNLTENKLLQVNQNISEKLYLLETDSDSVLNITANTNPEAGDLGSRDSVAASYKTTGTALGFFNSIKVLVSWIFVGEIGKMLLSVLGGLVGFTSVYFIVKWIRNGL